MPIQVLFSGFYHIKMNFNIRDAHDSNTVVAHEEINEIWHNIGFDSAIHADPEYKLTLLMQLLNRSLAQVESCTWGDKTPDKFAKFDGDIRIIDQHAVEHRFPITNFADFKNFVATANKIVVDKVVAISSFESVPTNLLGGAEPMRISAMDGEVKFEAAATADNMRFVQKASVKQSVKLSQTEMTSYVRAIPAASILAASKLFDRAANLAAGMQYLIKYGKPAVDFTGEVDISPTVYTIKVQPDTSFKCDITSLARLVKFDDLQKKIVHDSGVKNSECGVTNKTPLLFGAPQDAFTRDTNTSLKQIAKDNAPQQQDSWCHSALRCLLG